MGLLLSFLAAGAGGGWMSLGRVELIIIKEGLMLPKKCTSLQKQQLNAHLSHNPAHFWFEIKLVELF